METTENIYIKYIDSLNKGDFEQLSNYLHERLTYNGNEISLDDYKKDRQEEREAIPDLYYRIEILLADKNTIASRLNFDCTPIKEFMGIIPNGNRAVFSENVFYRIAQGKIHTVLSLVDIDAVRKQIAK